MGSSVTFRAVAVGAVLAGTFSLATASNASAAEARPIVLACKVPAGAWPGHYGSIGNQQNGETVCVVLGGKLLVSLSAPAGAGFCVAKHRGLSGGDPYPGSHAKTPCAQE